MEMKQLEQLIELMRKHGAIEVSLGDTHVLLGAAPITEDHTPAVKVERKLPPTKNPLHDHPALWGGGQRPSFND